MVSVLPVQRGFSLVELLVVVAIVAILIAAAIPQYRMFTIRADRADAVLTLNTVLKAEEALRGSTDSFYPPCPTYPVSCYFTPMSSPSIKDINEYLGLGRMLTTGRGWQFSWDYGGGGAPIDAGYITSKSSATGPTTKFVAFLTKDLDMKPGEELLSVPLPPPQVGNAAAGTNDKDWWEVQSCNQKIFASPFRLCGLPFQNRDDLDY